MRAHRLAAIVLLLFLPRIACAGTETWIVWVSDQACGAEHTKPGGAACIRKCLRGGAAVGHPEWVPQRVVLVRESDKTVWLVENPQSLGNREGERVRATVVADSTAKSVHVESIANPEAGDKP